MGIVSEKRALAPSDAKWIASYLMRLFPGEVSVKQKASGPSVFIVHDFIRAEVYRLRDRIYWIVTLHEWPEQHPKTGGGDDSRSIGTEMACAIFRIVARTRAARHQIAEAITGR